MKTHRLRAPSTDGGLLANPPLDELGPLLDANIQRLATWEYDFQGRSVASIRDLVRRELVDEARRFLGAYGISDAAGDDGRAVDPSAPFIVTGHQPELFHPGVWVKNFAAAALAAQRGGVALNLIVDDDIPKSSAIRAPRVANGRTTFRRIEFDRWEGEAPYEELPVHDEEFFASFGERVERALEGLIADPLIREYWPQVAPYRGTEIPLGLRLALGRRRVEGAWGVSNLEIPLSRMCETEGFYWFACHILAHLPRYLRTYNNALNEYRALYRIRSKNHPVTALARRGDWLEAPFWIWRIGGSRRRALFVRQDERSMLLRIADEADPFLELPLTQDGDASRAVERLKELEASPIRLRTRALTTTMFLRTLFGDLFIHGIGGAKYDELGDEITRRFMSIDPPDFLAMSMTVMLGLAEHETTQSALTLIDREIRSLIYNPDRHLPEPQDNGQRELVRRKAAAIAREPEISKERVERFREIRAINDALFPFVEERIDALRERRQGVAQQLAANRVARNREFSLALHSRERLRDLMEDVQAKVAEALKAAPAGPSKP